MVLEELEADECGGEEGDVGICHTLPKEAEISVQSTHAIRTSWSPEAAFGLFVPLVYPIQGETVEQGSVLIVGALEDREDRPPSNPVQANPQAISWVLGFKKEQEDIHRCWQPQVVAHDLEHPHKRPTVGMKLGDGDVELGEKLPLKASEGKPEFHLLEQSCVNKAERPIIVCQRKLAGRRGKVALSSSRRAPCGMIGEAHPPSSIAKLPQQCSQKTFPSTRSSWPRDIVFLSLVGERRLLR